MCALKSSVRGRPDSMRSLRRLAVMAALVALLSPVASAYYYWIFYARGGFVPVPAKFDLAALPEPNTVSYFISDQAPGPLAPGDSFQAIVSQIRAAADVWNDVSTSAVRLKFGGLASVATQNWSPGIDVVFDDNL